MIVREFWGGLNKPVCTVAPTITGDTIGDTLTVSSTWTGAVELRNEWYLNTVLVATTSTYDTSALQAGDVVYVREVALNAAGVSYASSSNLILADVGNLTIVSATINSAGDTLTVVLNGNDTITDETGWSLSFDNYAERVLTYSSGTGTNTFVFAISANPTYTDVSTDNDAAPVGVTITLNYDADTGNVGTLADVVGYSVTNNSTAHPDPDIPGSVPTGDLPVNWNAAADFTPSDMTALQALVNDETNNGTENNYTIIELTAGNDYEGELVIDHRCQYMLFRTSGYASLPVAGTRVTQSDEANMATISRVPSQPSHSVLSINIGAIAHTGSNNASTFSFSGGTWTDDELVGKRITNMSDQGSWGIITANTATTITATLQEINPANPNSDGDWDTGDLAAISDWTEVPHHLCFLGIKFEMTGSYGFDISNMTGSLTNGLSNPVLPYKVGFSHCVWTAADTIDVFTALIADFDDWFVADSLAYNIWGAGNNGSTAFWLYNSHRGLIANNELQSQSTPIFFGDNVSGSISDIEVYRCHSTRPSEWADTGTYGTAKAGAIEWKTGLRTRVRDCVFENLFNAAWEMLTIKVDGNFNNTSTNHVTVDRVFAKNATHAAMVHVKGSTDVPPPGAGPNTDILFRDFLVSNATGSARFKISVYKDTEQLARLKVDRMSLQGDIRSDGATPGNGFILKDSIVGGSYGYWHTYTGCAAINNAWGATADVQYDLFIGQSASNFDNDLSPAPLGILAHNGFPADEDDVYTDAANGDFTVSDSSLFKTSSSTGGKPGYDSTTCDPIWAEVIGA